MKIKQLLISTVLCTLVFGAFFSFAHAQEENSNPEASEEAQEPKTVTILGKPVLAKKSLITQKLSEALPESLNNKLAKGLMENRQKVRFYEHNPTIGSQNPKIQIIEFNDLGCTACHTTMRKIDNIRKKYNNIMQLVYVHFPENPYDATNLAAFYGKLAQDENKFWDYRTALTSSKITSQEGYLDVLLRLGITQSMARKAAIDKASTYYKQLDADTALSKQLRLSGPPHILVNGVLFGEQGLEFETLEDFIEYELFRLDHIARGY